MEDCPAPESTPSLRPAMDRLRPPGLEMVDARSTGGTICWNCGSLEVFQPLQSFLQLGLEPDHRLLGRPPLRRAPSPIVGLPVCKMLDNLPPAGSRNAMHRSILATFELASDAACVGSHELTGRRWLRNATHKTLWLLGTGSWPLNRRWATALQNTEPRLLANSSWTFQPRRAPLCCQRRGFGMTIRADKEVAKERSLHAKAMQCLRGNGSLEPKWLRSSGASAHRASNGASAHRARTRDRERQSAKKR